MTEEFLEEESDSLLEDLYHADEEVFDMDEEIEDTKTQIDELMKIYSSLKTHINEIHIDHIAKITDLKNEVEETRYQLQDQLSQQIENQNAEIEQMQRDHSQEIEAMEAELRSVQDIPYVYLEKEVEEFNKLNSLIGQQQEMHKTHMTTLRQSNTIKTNDKNYKNQHDFLLVEIENLQDAIARTRDNRNEVLRGLEQNSLNSQRQHEITMNRLKNEINKRDKCMEEHKKSIEKLIDREKKYAQQEISHLENNIKHMNEIKKKLIKNCTKQVSTVLQNIYKAERSLEKADSANNQLLTPEISEFDLDKLRQEKTDLETELARIKELNKQVYNAIV
ncbi:hypothetical protein TVAG_121310 [Trichomonas vaginalis G3]|uniref:Uncharacterized protein n=1 Tax=Trichomonas vaginalis (strain ATCC PRA-98 / G3) TaxID=412133 RepID=A2G0D8_TRIV3|nr:hypothetical protein TVAGG3_1008660 [Trichomonas vaginalis G3]EAX89387.1 hypothetical protein TVAG_121310 [Trichomonas vaginalis G3]KAI5491317.1 hypothetical protein TVAGG3_1008660 [Trichomonas vaginalis G3]|eukprot:XP_001302317.1 hypothetical protein [Trichomonas vaginalis G3]